jgi:hypothetical protein
MRTLNTLCCESVVESSQNMHITLTEHHAVKAYRESGGIAPLILWPRH